MNPANLTHSVGDRLRNMAAEQGVEAGRLRRQLVFQRILARLSRTDKWVLKGGYSLEVRLGLRARATRDLDVAFVGGESPTSVLDVQDILAEALEPDRDSDQFSFDVALPKAISADELGRPGWRMAVRAFIAAQHFDLVKLDVVARADEVRDGTEMIEVAPLLPTLGHTVFLQEAVDVAQHAAEKAHAYARVYAYDRPSSRVKDLVDLVLLTESGFLDVRQWGPRLLHVFAVREGTSPPPALPEPPSDWSDVYAAMVAELGAEATTASAAWLLVNDHYCDAISVASAK